MLGLLLATYAYAASIPMRQIAVPTDLQKGIKTVSLGTFSGPKGKGLSDAVTAAFQNPNRGELVDKPEDEGQKMLMAFTFGTVGSNPDGDAGAADEDQIVLADGIALDAVKLVASGGDAVLSGSAEYTFNDTPYLNQKTVTENGVTYKKTQYCTRRDVSVNYSWKLTAGGKDLLTDQQVKTTTRQACDAAVGALPPVDTIADTALHTAGIAIVDRFAPFIREFRIDLASGKAVKDGNKLVDKKDIAGAVCAYKASVDAKEEWQPVYNLAGALEGVGDAADALTWMQKAVGLKKTDEDQEALTRLQARVDEIARFEAAQGTTYAIAPVDFTKCTP